MGGAENRAKDAGVIAEAKGMHQFVGDTSIDFVRVGDADLYLRPLDPVVVPTQTDIAGHILPIR